MPSKPMSCSHNIVISFDQGGYAVKADFLHPNTILYYLQVLVVLMREPCSHKQPALRCVVETHQVVGEDDVNGLVLLGRS